MARVLWLTGSTFAVLGVPPIRGRLFTDEDDRLDCGIQGVVISYGFWQSEFGGRDSAIGSRLLIQGHPAEVLGVTPPDFFGLEVGNNFDLAEPFCSVTAFRPATSVLARRELFWLTVMGRLKPGWSTDQASVQLHAISPGLFEATEPDSYSTKSQSTYRAFRLAAYPAANGLSDLRKTYDASLLLLLGITGLVLLIACANLANLMLGKDEVLTGMADLRLRVLPYTADHALHLFDLPLHHSDPFDRQIIAQALWEKIPVVTSDEKFSLYKGLRIVW